MEEFKLTIRSIIRESGLKDQCKFDKIFHKSDLNHSLLDVVTVTIVTLSNDDEVETSVIWDDNQINSERVFRSISSHMDDVTEAALIVQVSSREYPDSITVFKLDPNEFEDDLIDKIDQLFD